MEVEGKQPMADVLKDQSNKENKGEKRPKKRQKDKKRHKSEEEDPDAKALALINSKEVVPAQPQEKKKVENCPHIDKNDEYSFMCSTCRIICCEVCLKDSHMGHRWCELVPYIPSSEEEETDTSEHHEHHEVANDSPEEEIHINTNGRRRLRGGYVNTRKPRSKLREKNCSCRGCKHDPKHLKRIIPIDETRFNKPNNLLAIENGPAGEDATKKEDGTGKKKKKKKKKGKGTLAEVAEHSGDEQKVAGDKVSEKNDILNKQPNEVPTDNGLEANLNEQCQLTGDQEEANSSSPSVSNSEKEISTDREILQQNDVDVKESSENMEEAKATKNEKEEVKNIDTQSADDMEISEIEHSAVTLDVFDQEYETEKSSEKEEDEQLSGLSEQNMHKEDEGDTMVDSELADEADTVAELAEEKKNDPVIDGPPEEKKMKISSLESEEEKEVTSKAMEDTVIQEEHDTDAVLREMEDLDQEFRLLSKGTEKTKTELKSATESISSDAEPKNNTSNARSRSPSPGLFWKEASPPLKRLMRKYVGDQGFDKNIETTDGLKLILRNMMGEGNFDEEMADSFFQFLKNQKETSMKQQRLIVNEETDKKPKSKASEEKSRDNMAESSTPKVQGCYVKAPQNDMSKKDTETVEPKIVPKPKRKSGSSKRSRDEEASDESPKPDIELYTPPTMHYSLSNVLKVDSDTKQKLFEAFKFGMKLTTDDSDFLQHLTTELDAKMEKYDDENGEFAKAINDWLKLPKKNRLCSVYEGWTGVYNKDPKTLVNSLAPTERERFIKQLKRVLEKCYLSEKKSSSEVDEDPEQWKQRFVQVKTGVRQIKERLLKVYTLKLLDIEDSSTVVQLETFERDNECDSDSKYREGSPKLVNGFVKFGDLSDDIRSALDLLNMNEGDLEIVDVNLMKKIFSMDLSTDSLMKKILVKDNKLSQVLEYVIDPVHWVDEVDEEEIANDAVAERYILAERKRLSSKNLKDDLPLSYWVSQVPDKIKTDSGKVILQILQEGKLVYPYVGVEGKKKRKQTVPADVYTMCAVENHIWVHKTGSESNILMNRNGKISKELDFGASIEDFTVTNEGLLLASDPWEYRIISVENSCVVKDYLNFDSLGLMPLGINWASKKSLIVCFVESYYKYDVRSNPRRLVARVSVKTGKITQEIEWKTKTERWFTVPRRAVEAPNGDFIVIDRYQFNRGRVMMFAPDGAFRYQWGGHSDICNKPFDPRDVQCDHKGRVFLADYSNNMIMMFDLPKEGIKIFCHDNNASNICFPLCLTLDKQYQLWVGCKFGKVIFMNDGKNVIHMDTEK